MSETQDRPFACFPNYTWEMYYGNEPAGKGHELVGGGFADRWDCRYGDAETNGEQILHASFTISPKVNLYICRDSLWIVDVRYRGKGDFWECCINHPGMPGAPCVSERNRHKLEHENVMKYLDAKFPNCLLWDMVQKRAKELYLSSMEGGGSLACMKRKPNT